MAVVCLLAVPRFQLFVSACNRSPHNALPVSYHFPDFKALLLTILTRVSSDIANVYSCYVYASGGLVA